MRWMLFLIALFSFLKITAQTCIIIHVAPNGITAGADRLYHETLSVENNNGKQQHSKIYYARKIFSGVNVHWALSGADYHDVIHCICREACGKNISLVQIINTVQRRLRESNGKTAMQQIVAASNADQRKRIKGNMTEIAFFRYEDHAYKAYRLTLSMPALDKGNTALRMETDSIRAGKSSYGLFVMGHYDAFDKNNKSADWSRPAQTISRLIREQAVITPDDVSADANIISITKERTQWLK